MTNNFYRLKDFLKNRYYTNAERSAFDTDADSCYVVEIIRRGKDCPNMHSANYHFKNYYIHQLSDLEKYQEEIITVCDALKMRAYLSVNPRSLKQVMLNTSAEYARRIAEGNFEKPYKVYETCSGKYAPHEKLWVIDVDKEDATAYDMPVNYLAELYQMIIQQLNPTDIVMTTVPTKSGFHIICKPFDVLKFNELCVQNHITPHNEQEHSIIHKNPLTLLYENI